MREQGGEISRITLSQHISHVSLISTTPFQTPHDWGGILNVVFFFSRSRGYSIQPVYKIILSRSSHMITSLLLMILCVPPAFVVVVLRMALDGTTAASNAYDPILPYHTGSLFFLSYYQSRLWCYYK